MLIEEAMSTENVDSFRPEQCRAARALLGLSQPDLAKAAGVGLSTVVDFEKSRRAVALESVQRMYKALERAGVEFIAENGGGPGVRIRNRRAKKNFSP
jgi:transcriptional regulator with XRE-family HTH domain